MTNVRVQKFMKQDIVDAGGDNHPLVKKFLANRAAILACQSGPEVVKLIIKGAMLWRAVHNRAKRSRAAKQGWEKKKGT